MKRRSPTIVEMEIIGLVTIGKTNQQIADITGKSKRTIDGQISRILKVLRVGNRVGIATWAEKHGLKEDR